MRLAIIATHPIQYHVPWFQYLANQDWVESKVFYLHQPDQSGEFDPGFKRQVKWDIPLLEGYPHCFVPNQSSKPSTTEFLGLYNPELESALDTFNPDACLLLGYFFRTYLSFIFRAKWPMIFRGDSHRLGSQSLKQVFKDQIISRIYRRFDAVLCVGEANRTHVLDLGVAESRVFHSPPAVDVDRFCLTESMRDEGLALRKQLSIREDQIVFLFVGKLEWKKDPGSFVNAVRELGSDDCVAVLVGEGDLSDDLQRSAGKNERWAGFINQQELPKWYAAADALVLPSQDKTETWGMVVNEAMAMQLPCIVSDLVGCGPDLVKPGKTGWIFPAGDKNALRDVLRGAMKIGRAGLADMGGKARELVLSEFTYANTTQGLHDALNFIVKTDDAAA